MMPDSNAWMMSFGTDRRAAVGELELVHVLPDAPELFPVLKAPAHCREVFLWEGHVLPVFDLTLWFGETREEHENAHLGVFRYRSAPGGPLGYGSLVIEGAPRQVQVSDSQACELPEGGGPWRSIARACFDYGGRPVPVLNLPRMFAGVPRVA